MRRRGCRSRLFRYSRHRICHLEPRLTIRLRSALRWLARSTGAACHVVYLPVDKNVQLARIAHRQETTPHQTFPMSEADVDQWREQFQVPDAVELAGGAIPGPPAGWPGWPEWAVDHWPSLTGSAR